MLFWKFNDCHLYIACVGSNLHSSKSYIIISWRLHVQEEAACEKAHNELLEQEMFNMNYSKPQVIMIRGQMKGLVV